jgi:glutathione S-transferase
MAGNNTIKLYDLVLKNGLTLSPFVWRTKLAIMHKGFDIDAVPTPYAKIKTIADGKQTRLPVIEDDGKVIPDSFDIAVYLDTTYPDRPKLFNSQGERNYMRFLDQWMFANVVRHLFGCFVLDQVEHSCPEDVDYIRESRQNWFFQGRKLEYVVKDREERIPEIRKSLDPIREHLKNTKWFAGDAPNQLDFMMLSHFLWAGSIGTMPFLAKTDPLWDWLNRAADVYPDVSRDKRLHPLA